MDRPVSFSYEGSDVAEFFASRRCIFITGVTGFLGKVLLHKLLDVLLKKKVNGGNFPDICVLIRPSKKVGPGKVRLVKEVFSSPIFETMLKEHPQLPDMIEVVEGDIMKDNLGLSSAQLNNLQNKLEVILHCAATTKFMENLLLALQMNVLGVRRMLEIAKNSPNFVSFVHVSTCYVNADKVEGREIPEEISPVQNYPNYRAIVDRIASLTPEEADEITESTIRPYPNTYTFTKAIGENLVKTEKGSLPLAIVRPSIVTGSLKEPLPGWVDALLGPAGLFLATGVGMLRVMHGSEKIVADFIPVDLVSNAILTAAWRNARLKCDWKKTLPVYQISSSSRNPVTWAHTRHLVVAYFRLHRPKRNLSYPFGRFVPNKYVFKAGHAVFHVLPASLIDGTRYLQGKKPFMMKATSRLHNTISSLAWFTSHNWFFSSDNTAQMCNELNDVDKEYFNIDVSDINWDHYFITYCDGLRKFLLKEEEKPKSKL